jgi:hypothetical protein
VNDVDDKTAPANSNENEYPPEDTLGDQSLRRSGADVKGLWTLSPRDGAECYARVSRLAYELYLRRGGNPGHELDDWLAAERIVLSQIPYHGRRKNGDRFDGKSTR